MSAGQRLPPSARAGAGGPRAQGHPRRPPRHLRRPRSSGTRYPAATSRAASGSAPAPPLPRASSSSSRCRRKHRVSTRSADTSPRHSAPSRTRGPDALREQRIRQHPPICSRAPTPGAQRKAPACACAVVPSTPQVGLQPRPGPGRVLGRSYQNGLGNFLKKKREALLVKC